MKKLLLILAFCVSAMNIASAQRDIPGGMVHEIDHEPFTTVRVSDDFVVELIASDRYYTRTTTDKRLYPFIKTFVQNGTLYVSIDRKSFPSDLKKELRAKGAPAPILEVQIAFPALRTLELAENAIVHKSDVIYGEEFTLSVTDKARVDRIYLDCKTAEVFLSKSAYAEIDSKVDKKLFVYASNASKGIVNQTGEAVYIEPAGTSIVDARLDVGNVEIVASGSSSTKLISGTIGQVVVKSSGSAKVDAESVQIPEAEMIQEGSSKCYMNVTDNMKVNLTGNSQLTFKNNPHFDVERIIGSTLIKADDPKRK